MTKPLELPKFKTYKPRRVFHATSNITMTEDKTGNWVSRSDAEHLAELLQQANTRISELENREVVIPTIWKHYGTGKACCLYEQAMDEAGIKWRSVDD